MDHLNLSKKQSIKGQFVILIGSLAISIILITLYSFFSYYHLQLKVLKDNQAFLSSQASQTLSTHFENTTKISLSLAYNQTVQDYLKETGKQDRFNLYKELTLLLNNTKTINEEIIDIAIIGLDNNSVNIEGDIYIPTDLLSSLPQNDNIYFFGKIDYYISQSLRPCIMAGMWIYPLDGVNSSHPLGAIFIALDPSVLLKSTYLQWESQFLELIFLDRDNNLILGNQNLYDAFIKDNLLKHQNALYYDDKKYLCQYYDIQAVDGLLVSFLPKSAFIHSLTNIMIQQFILILIAFLIVGSLLFTLFKRILYSVNQLVGIMNRINNGQYKALKERITPSHAYACKEIHTISQAFNEMLDEINKLNRQIFDTYSQMYELEITNKKTEIAFLRSQINPHFLYNTLTLICGMSTEGNSLGIINITQALAKIFRYSVKGDDMVTLKEELEITKSYLMIQSTRFEDRFSIEYFIDKNTLNTFLPKMILQPLVENAIVHGLEPILIKGTLKIEAQLESNHLILTISDTGVGIDEIHLSQIKTSLNSSRFSIPSSIKNTSPFIAIDTVDNIGLHNVNTRIKLYYGESYSLNITSQTNLGTRVQIKIPRHT